MNFFDANFDLEQTLLEDSKGDNLKKMQKTLDDTIAALQRKISRGLKKEEFASAESLLKATETAKACLEKTWTFFHK